ncbi:hypothetical protein [Clostridium butyricum]|uniref:Putative mads-domain transcription factor Ggm15 n=1 Tax=Clostridium butyricum E4 str. BoNT E BL5262 TaxID=632245 RepID=C4IGU9_CLOBU|nr:hypothetical protein [Clostridium butyricum]EDT74746.1 putative mads-domain transcription factor Ggm15 [Clostridium butyricum 5521]EEP54280.1 putative mads-domain transcription factor Ggm15 [Clostridium butyricum E4 str. BoNT E BL5262]NFL30515.1 transcription factor [Clostridium butyricum]NFS19470.1 transcription factor [Clostridium butyricum]
MEKTLISRNTLAERWDFDSPQSLINYENEGVLTRNPNFKKPKYYMEEVLKIETLQEVNPLSPLERVRLEKTIRDLEKEKEYWKSKVEVIKTALS